MRLVWNPAKAFAFGPGAPGEGDQETGRGAPRVTWEAVP